MKNTYPQHEFAEAVTVALRAAHFPEGAEVLDLPCGSGATTFGLAQNFLRCAVTGVDLDAGKIDHARRFFQQKILCYEAADIFDWLRQTPRLDALCLINSLFLLPNTDALLRLIAEKMDGQSLFVCIIPNTASRNFQNFQRLQPQVNHLQISRADIKPFFARYGFRTESVQGIVFQHFYRLLWPKLLGPLRHGVLRRLHHRNSGRVGAEACYFLIVLKR